MNISCRLAILALAGAAATNSMAGADRNSDRAEWLRGSWGINWKPVDLYNGRGENLTIDNFLEQISGLKTLDYLQLHLGDSYTKSPVHLGPHDLLESLWQGDTDADGKPINLVVPRAAAGVDPFLEMLKATRAAGLKTQVYVNSSNMLERGVDIPNPASFPNITDRWKAFCDTNPEVQAFINSKSYHTNSLYPERKYMFSYAEFVLKDYSIRYGDLVDGWLFDSGIFMTDNGDSATNGEKADQRIYKAFAEAARAGNRNAAVSFNNGPERDTEELNPFSEAVRYEDYMFGHPYNGGTNMGRHDNGNYARNYAHIEKMTETGGNVHVGGDWKWDDKVVGHFDPPMSTARWNAGGLAALTDEEFMLWNLEATRAGGAISWGAPLEKAEGDGNQLLIRDWGMAQLSLMDEHLSVYQSPGAPNWARVYTPLPDATFGQAYSRTLIEGVDFWDPEGDAVTLSLLHRGGRAPHWLSLEQDPSNPGRWILHGIPSKHSPGNYTFILRAEDASGATERRVELRVGEPASVYPFKGSSQINASADTDYGIDSVATMVSEVQTAPDGLATFQIAFDVTPMAGGSVQSGTSGGVSTSTSWGIGSDNIFKGSDGESLDSIDNIRIINFTANGSSLSVDDFSDLSFVSAEIVNGQSPGDRILATANGVANESGGVKIASNPGDLNLKLLGYVPVTTVTLAVGNDLTTNKWSVNSFLVSYVIKAGSDTDSCRIKAIAGGMHHWQWLQNWLCHIECADTPVSHYRSRSADRSWHGDSKACANLQLRGD